MHESVLAINTNLEVERVNSAAEQLFGLTSDKMHRATLQSIFSEHNAEKIKNKLTQRQLRRLRVNTQCP